MCGRFARIVSDRTLREKYRLERMVQPRDGYNIAPQQSIGAVRTVETGRELVLLKWGLIPSWSKDPTSCAGSGESSSDKSTPEESPRRWP
jgi:putative SOS response-associated peptidase YedK